MKAKVLVAQSCPTLCDPMDCSLPDSSVCGILQTRILEWIAIPFCRVSSQPMDRSMGLLHCSWILYCLSHQGSPMIFIIRPTLICRTSLLFLLLLLLSLFLAFYVTSPDLPFYSLILSSAEVVFCVFVSMTIFFISIIFIHLFLKSISFLLLFWIVLF